MKRKAPILKKGWIKSKSTSSEWWTMWSGLAAFIRLARLLAPEPRTSWGQEYGYYGRNNRDSRSTFERWEWWKRSRVKQEDVIHLTKKYLCLFIVDHLGTCYRVKWSYYLKDSLDGSSLLCSTISHQFHFIGEFEMVRVYHVQLNYVRSSRKFIHGLYFVPWEKRLSFLTLKCARDFLLKFPVTFSPFSMFKSLLGRFLSRSGFQLFI